MLYIQCVCVCVCVGGGGVQVQGFEHRNVRATARLLCGYIRPPPLSCVYLVFGANACAKRWTSQRNSGGYSGLQGGADEVCCWHRCWKKDINSVGKHSFDCAGRCNILFFIHVGNAVSVLVHMRLQDYMSIVLFRIVFVGTFLQLWCLYRLPLQPVNIPTSSHSTWIMRW